MFSIICLQTLSNFPGTAIIKSFIESINSILFQESQIDYEASELVTTLTIVVIQGNRLYGANVGDSRVYLYRDTKLNQLSFDHTTDEKGFERKLTRKKFFCKGKTFFERGYFLPPGFLSNSSDFGRGFFRPKGKFF